MRPIVYVKVDPALEQMKLAIAAALRKAPVQVDCDRTFFEHPAFPEFITQAVLFGAGPLLKLTPRFCGDLLDLRCAHSVRVDLYLKEAHCSVSKCGIYRRGELLPDLDKQVVQ